MESFKVYKVTNVVTGKVYIGQTSKSIEDRWKQHVLNTRYSYMCGRLKKSIIKHGEDSFVVEELDSAVSLAQVLQKEIYWISTYNSTDPSVGYNITGGGEGTLGYKFSPEVVESRAQKSRGLVRTPETREKLRQAHLGFVPTEVTRQRLRIANLGKNLGKKRTQSQITNIKQGMQFATERKRSLGLPLKQAATAQHIENARKGLMEYLETKSYFIGLTNKLSHYCFSVVGFVPRYCILTARDKRAGNTEACLAVLVSESPLAQLLAPGVL